MICIKTRYFSINKILLLAVGLWPYQRSKFVQLQVIFCFTIMVSFVIFQLTPLLRANCTSEFIFRVFSFVLLFVSSIIHYNAFVINAKAVKYLLEQLQYICSKLKDDNEIAIITKYGSKAKRYTVIFTLFSMCGFFTIICLSLWPQVLEIILPINESRSFSLYIITDYFIDEKQYFYLIVLHLNTACCISGTAVLGTATTFLVCVEHACGIFRIASYRIEQAMTLSISQKLNLRNETITYKEMAYAVDMHRKAMKVSEFLISSFEGTFFSLLMIGVICLSLHLFRISQILSSNEDMMDLLIHFVLVIVILTYLFVSNYIGQEITDHNDHVFLTAYNARWYIAPLHMQKLILFLMQRGNKIFYLKFGGMFIASLDNFATMTKASVSYFTVIYSTQ